MRERPILKAELLSTLPPEWPQDPFPEIQRRVQSTRQRVAVLDDDPTGTQTVHSLWVVTQWTPEALRSVLKTGPSSSSATPVFYILTNSRSLPQDEAVFLNREIARNLAKAAGKAGCHVDVVSRSDSTLRGHFPAEIDTLRETLEPLLPCTYDGTVVCPYFLEGGRLTAYDVHWVTEGEQLIPAGQTEYARDVTFGYQHSNLREWIEEKTQRRESPPPVSAGDVVSVSLNVIRKQGPEGVRRVLAQVTGGRVAIVNAVTYRDMAVFVAGLLDAQQRGQRFLFRTAASFVKVRGGVPDRGLLTSREMFVRDVLAREVLARETPPDPAAGSKTGTSTGGLTVVGSYVDKTTRQLRRARQLSGLVALELSVPRVLDPTQRANEIERILRATNDALLDGQDALVFTSREQVTEHGRAGELEIGQQVSAALVEVVRHTVPTPHYVIAKGGITASDVATRGLGVQRAWVLGQILPGIPVWRLGTESRFPGLPYTVFPGNVGTDDSLFDAIQILRGNE